MGKQSHQNESCSGQRNRVLTALVLCSILGMGVGIQPVWAADVTEKSVTMSSGSGSAYGGQASGTDNAVNNTLTISGTAEVALAYGGYADQGKATGNTLNISGGSLYQGFGGSSNTNEASGNNVNLTGGKIIQTLSAGSSSSGNTDHNTLSVSGITQEDSTEAAYLRGAQTTGGSAAYNKVELTNVTTKVKGLDGAFIIDGSGDASYNQVTVTGSSLSISKTDPVLINGAINAGSGKLYHNTVIIDSTNLNGSGARAADRSYDVTGTAEYNELIVRNGGKTGYLASAYQRYGDASHNTVTVTSSEAAGVQGANIGQKGNSVKNEVVVTDSTVETAVQGGVTALGSAVGNSVTVDGTSTVSWYVEGGSTFASEGKVGAAGNQVTVTGTASVPEAYGGRSTGADVVGNSVTYNSLAGQTEVAVLGGYSVGGNAGQEETFTYDGVSYEGGNTVTAAGNSSFLDIMGGYAAADDSGKGGNAVNNTVSFDGTQGAAVQNIYGGVAQSGNAAKNTLSLNKGTVSINAYGGYSGSGDATGNTFETEGATVVGSAYGGFTATGSASDNIVTVKSGNLGGATSGELVGGRALVGTAVNNQVTVEDGTLALVYGGATGALPVGSASVPATAAATVGDVTGNTVTIKGGTLNTAAGGFTSELATTDTEGKTLDLPAGKVSGNKVLVSGGNLGYASGGQGGENVTGNTAEQTGGTVMYLAGGRASSGTIAENKAALSGGTAMLVLGGWDDSSASTVTQNQVTVSGGEVGMEVVAGMAVQGDATGNTLTITGGTIGNQEASGSNLIAGGYASAGAADDNTVTIKGGLLGHMMSLYGGYSTTESTGNTLNLYTKDNTVENLGYFQTLNFYVPEGTKAGETMLEVTGTADVHGAAINASVEDTTQLNPGEVINLIHDGNNEINTTGTSYDMMDGKDIVTDAAFLQRRAYIKKQDANTIVLYVPIDSQPILHPDTEVIADGQANAASTVANGSDAAVTDGLQAALTAWAESHEAARLREDDHAAMGMTASPYISSPAGMSVRQNTAMAANMPLDAADAKNGSVPLSQEEMAAREDRDVEAKFTPYVMLGGHNLRYNSSSTVDTNGFNGELGFVKRVFNKNSADTIMPFVEYGTGNYTSFKNGTRGDGSQRYVGAGILLRRDLDNGVHYEGLIRAGRLNGDYAGRIAGYRTTYNSGAGYIAAHAGLGKIYRQDSNDYNLYSKFFYSHLGGDSVTLHSSIGSADYELGSVDSYWTRLGFRWTKHLDEDTTTFYAGLGWDYEFDGKATARYRDYTTPDASMKGSSEFLELGWQSKVTKENPWGGRCESHRVERRETGLYIWGNHHAPHVAVLADRQKEAFILV